MTLRRHRQFIRHYKKRILSYPEIDKKFEERLNLFIQDAKHPLLKDHKLSGRLEGLRAFSITGDIRVVYRLIGQSIELYDIGSHNQVY